MKSRELTIPELLRELLVEGASGIPSSRELVASEPFFDVPAERIALAESEFLAKFETARRELEVELGPGRVADRQVDWNRAGTDIRLVLEHEDREMPIVLVLHANRVAKPLGTVGSKPSACGSLKATPSPFHGKPLILVSKNASLRKTHVRVAEATVNSVRIDL